MLGPIAQSGRPLTVAQIGRAMGLTRQSVQRVVDKLESVGIVRRIPHPEHRRARLVELTVGGKSQYAAVMRRQVPWANRTAAGHSPSTLATALRVVRVLRARLQAAPPNR